MPGGQGLARPARKLADLSDTQAAQHHPQAAIAIMAETLPAVSPRTGSATDQEHDLVLVQPPRGGQQCLAGSGIGPMQVLDHRCDRAGVLRCAQQGQQLHACRERVTGADRRQPGQDAQRHITRQLVRLRPQHLTSGRQPGEDLAQQRGLPRPGGPFDPDRLGLARDRSINAGRDRDKFDVAPDEDPLAHRPGTRGCITVLPPARQY